MDPWAGFSPSFAPPGFYEKTLDAFRKGKGLKMAEQEQKPLEINKNQRPILTDARSGEELKESISDAITLINFKRPDLAVKHLEILTKRIHGIEIPTNCDRFPDCPNFRKLADGKATLFQCQQGSMP